MKFLKKILFIAIIGTIATQTSTSLATQSSELSKLGLRENKNETDHLTVLGCKLTEVMNSLGMLTLVIVDIDSEKEGGFAFTEKVLAAFNEIGTTKLGKKLLDETIGRSNPKLDDGPLVVLQTGLIQRFGETALQLLTTMHNREFIRYVSFGNEVYLRDELEMKNVPQFMAKVPKEGWKNDMLFLGDFSMWTTRLKLQDYILKEKKEHKMTFTEENLDFATTVFHELNHYRHYLNKEGTYYTNAGNGAKEMHKDIFNSLNITLKLKEKNSGKIVKIGARMKSMEEELQLTGFTVLDTKDHKDTVNQTYYSIQKSSQDGMKNDLLLRYPYICPIVKKDERVCIVTKLDDEKATSKNIVEEFDCFIDDEDVDSILRKPTNFPDENRGDFINHICALSGEKTALVPEAT